MEISVLNEDRQLEKVVDQYDSLIWTERYNKYGDFEIMVPANDEMLHAFQLERLIEIELSNLTMIIEKLVVETDAENGNMLTVKGRSLESILDRRIVWGLKVLTGNFQNAIKTLLNECIISPSIVDRKIEKFKFVESTDPRITALKIDTQFTGDNLYEVINGLCLGRDLGFQVLFNDLNEMEFELYFGTDRSFDQLANPFVTFSPEFDNLISSKYTNALEMTKNVTLIGGEGEGKDRRYATVGSGSGLKRRELFTDARDISSEPENGVTLTNAEYTKQLQERGSLKLSENVDKPEFEANVANINYQVGKDYFKGDVVNISNGFGQDERARITEIIISDDSSGLEVYPTFEVIEE